MGMVDRGADLKRLSQYPHEEEVLFNPLTGLEVQSTFIEGRVLVVRVKVSVNLMSLTLDDVVGKRKKLLQEMARQIVGRHGEVGSRLQLRYKDLQTRQDSLLDSWSRDTV